MKIDAHQHYWRLERGDYGWLTPDMGVLYRDYAPEDLLPHLDRHGIERTIVVQAAPTVAETDYMLGLCEREPRIAGVVGWLDLESDGFERELLRLRNNPRFVGVRPMLQDMDDDAYVLRPQVQRSIALLAEHDVPLDLCVKPRHLPYVRELLKQQPLLRAVVDHLAKPNIAARGPEQWSRDLAEVAAYPNVFAKLSGLITEANPGAWTPDDFVPYVREAVRLFGPGRLMFGSDWPVCLLAGSYDEVVGIMDHALPEGLTEQERSGIFGGNAATFYRLAL